MQRLFDPRRLDTQAFAQDAAALSGSLTLRDLPRLREEATGACDDRPIRWSSQGQWRAVAGGPEQAWLQLEAQVSLPLTCQRCLTPVEVDLRISRPFRFVADEATALQEDDESEEDLLVSSQSFDLVDLVEDELIMELPAVARHDTCPVTVKLSVADPEFEAEGTGQPHPFAALQALRSKKSN